MTEMRWFLLRAGIVFVVLFIPLFIYHLVRNK
jgi:hypothetical protein